jgi:hypothetical protein
MPRDARLYVDDAELSPFSRSFRPECFSYLIAWRHAGIVKVGETWSPRRWRGFVGTGAEVLLIVRTDTGTALAIEGQMYEHFRNTAEQAFASKQDSLPYVRGAGGHLECFRADPDETLQKMLEVVHGVVQG